MVADLNSFFVQLSTEQGQIHNILYLLPCFSAFQKTQICSFAHAYLRQFAIITHNLCCHKV